MNHPKKKLYILPGWGGTKETWKYFCALAEEYFDVDVIELPCFGSEPCPNEVWGIEEYAEFVRKQIEKKTHHLYYNHPCTEKRRDILKDSEIPQIPLVVRDDVIVLGHSFGGQVATYVTAKHPELVGKLILVAPAVVRSKIQCKRLFFLSIAKIGKSIAHLPGIHRFDALLKKILYRIADSPDYSATSGIQREIYQNIIRQDLTHLLPTVMQQTLVIWGSDDRVTPIWQAKKMMRILPHASLHVIQHGRHGLHHERTANSLLDTISTFLTSTP